MHITKLVHSCIFIEEGDRKVLVDPGIYSWQSGLVEASHMEALDVVVVTHAHPDHLNEEFARAIHESSPKAVWYGPNQVAETLSEWGIDCKSESDTETAEFVESDHADLSPWFPEQPEHTSFLLFGEVLIGGDCHTLKSGRNAKVFGGAISGGPWGAVVGFSKMIEDMSDRPEKVIPLHDWHWHDEAISGLYARLPEVLSQFGVDFVALKNGERTQVG